jgi:hypothetical protein
MYEQNPLEMILYGDTQGKRTFNQFRKESGLSEEKTSFIDEDKRTRNSKGNDTVRRMENSHQKRQRTKKVQKLNDNPDHWKGLN